MKETISSNKQYSANEESSKCNSNKTMKQISIFLENKVGSLSDLLDYLDKNKVNINAMNITETDKYGVVKILVDKPEQVEELLNSDEYIVHTSEIFVVSVSHKYGSLKNLVKMLTDEGINIEYVYSMVYYHSKECAFIAIAVDDIVSAQKCFEANGIQLVAEF